MTQPLSVAFDSRTRNHWPSYCDVCKTSAWFRSETERREWEEALHTHGGVD